MSHNPSTLPPPPQKKVKDVHVFKNKINTNRIFKNFLQHTKINIK